MDTMTAGSLGLLRSSFPVKATERLFKAFSLGKSVHVRCNDNSASASLLWLLAQEFEPQGQVLFVDSSNSSFNTKDAVTKDKNIVLIDPFLDPMFHVLRIQPDVVIANGDNVLRAKTGVNYHTGIAYPKEYLKVQHQNMLYVLRKRNVQVLSSGTASLAKMQNDLRNHLREEVSLNYDIEVTLSIKPDAYGSGGYRIIFNDLDNEKGKNGKRRDAKT